MHNVSRVRWARALGVTVVAMTFALMVLGSWVKATGSGLACPDWPQCYGDWLPPFPSADNGGTWEGERVAFSQAQILYEWGHRLLASLLAIPFLAWAVITATGNELSRGLRYLPAAAGVVLVAQIGLGGITVVGGNAAPLTTAHLATATVFMVLVTLATAFAFLKPMARGSVIVAVKKVPGEVRVVYPGEDPHG